MKKVMFLLPAGAFAFLLGGYVVRVLYFGEPWRQNDFVVCAIVSVATVLFWSAVLLIVSEAMRGSPTDISSIPTTEMFDWGITVSREGREIRVSEHRHPNVLVCPFRCSVCRW